LGINKTRINQVAYLQTRTSDVTSTGEIISFAESFLVSPPLWTRACMIDVNSDEIASHLRVGRPIPSFGKVNLINNGLELGKQR
jgi:hypothetical protein